MGNGRCRWRKDETFSSWENETVDPQRSVPRQVGFDVVFRVWRFAESDGERLVRDGQLLRVGEVFGERKRDVEEGRVREEEEHRQAVGADDQTASREGLERRMSIPGWKTLQLEGKLCTSKPQESESTTET